jgi:sulfate permease, SulP family
MSSAEAFVRVQRLLAGKRVVLVFCGFSAESAVGKSLRNVDVLGAEGVELFENFNDAMECKSAWSLGSSGTHVVVGTENAYLRAWFRSQKTQSVPVCMSRQKVAPYETYIGWAALPGRQDTDIAFQHSLASSPRRSHLHDAATRTIANGQ